MKPIHIGGSGRGVASIFAGALGAQIISFAVLPIISRLYSPGEFGYFALIIALAGIIAPSAMLRFETAAMLPDTIQQVRALTRLALIGALIVSVLFGSALQVLSVFGLYGLAEYPMLPVWVTLFVLLTCAFTLLSQLSLRKREYSLVATRSFLQSVATAASQTAIGLAPQLPSGLLIGAVLGKFAGVAVLARSTKEFFAPPTRGGLLEAWIGYWRFPAAFAPSALLNSLGLQAPLVYFTIGFGISAGGQLGMAERIVAVPVTLIGAAFGQVLDAEISRRVRERAGGLLPLYLRFSLILGTAAIAVALLGGLFGAAVIPLLLGAQWETAGALVEILAITSAFRLVAGPLSKIIILMQRTRANLVLDALRFGLMLIAMLTASWLSLSLVPAVWLVYSALTITYIVLWAYGLRVAKTT